MNTDDMDNDGRQESRAMTMTNGGFSQESVFGDPQWVLEHLDWIKRHYQGGNGPGEVVV